MGEVFDVYKKNQFEKRKWDEGERERERERNVGIIHNTHRMVASTNKINYGFCGGGSDHLSK